MSAHLHPGTNSRKLKGRAAYFFGSSTRSRGEVAEFASLLSKLGPVAAIGGLLRDLCLSGTRDFCSDIDFVVDPGSMREFEQLALRMGARANRFGGYGIELDRWKVDVWPLARTWANVAGHVRVSTLDDLLKVTFFDWDAVLYLVGDRKIIASKGYFERLQSRVLDINLEPNPNPLGNAVRAVRYSYRWDAYISQRLAAHLARQIHDHGWDGLVASERHGFANRILPSLDGDRISSYLQDFEERGGVALKLPVRPLQHDLPLAV